MTKEERKEYDHQRYLKRREQILERNKKWREANPDKVKEKQRKWRETNPDYMKDYMKEWREENPDYDKQRYQENPDKAKEIVRKYQSTPIGRANYLVNNYRRHDKNAKRGECTIEDEWIVDNIFTSKCIYCGETDWTKLGCDRIYNDLPHTLENVVCCCEECNKKRGTKPFEEFCKEMGVEPITVKTEIIYI